MPQHVVGLIEAKSLKTEAYLLEGFKRGWIHRKGRLEKPRAPEAVRLAAWLEVPTEYLFGAAPEYDRMEAWEAASRASLDVFLKRHPERVEARRFRDLLERHVDTHRKRAPRTVAEWAALFDAMVKAVGQAMEEQNRLEQSAAAPSESAPAT